MLSVLICLLRAPREPAQPTSSSTCRSRRRRTENHMSMMTRAAVCELGLTSRMLRRLGQADQEVPSPLNPVLPAFRLYSAARVARWVDAHRPEIEAVLSKRGAARAARVLAAAQ